MESNRTLKSVLIVVAFVIALLLLPATLYVVDRREQVVVLQFGRPVAERVEPGIYVKWPLIQEVRTLPRTLQFWGGTQEDVLPDLPTKDGKKIEVVAWAVWRVSDPSQFVEKLREMDVAERRIHEFVRGAVRDTITQFDLAELIRSTDRELTYSLADFTDGDLVLSETAQPAVTDLKNGRLKIVEEIKRVAQQNLSSGGAAGRGIELVDVGISQIEFVDSVQESAFDRQIAFMESIAAHYTNEGEKRKQQILNATSAEVQKIEGEGKKESSEIRGEIDAEVITAYAEAIRETGEFYNFIRTLEAYKSALGKNTRMILTTDSEFLRLLKDPSMPLTPTLPETATTRE